MCNPTQALYACIDDTRSRSVNERVGFVPAGGHQCLFVNPMASSTPEEIADVTRKVAQAGMF